MKNKIIYPKAFRFSLECVFNDYTLWRITTDKTSKTLASYPAFPSGTPGLSRSVTDEIIP